MSPTRTRKPIAPKAEVTATVEAVSAAIDRNVKYLAKSPTANLAAFAAYAIGEAEKNGTVKTKAEREAFALGNRLAGLRSKFTDDRKNGKIEATESFADYAIRSSGVTVPTDERARSAFLAGIASYTRYVSYRSARESSAAGK